MPGLTVHSTVSLSGVIFLSDGIHALIGLDTRPSGTGGQTVFPYQIEGHVPTYSNEQALNAAITEKESQIQSMRASLQLLTSHLKVSDSDFRIWVSKNLLSTVADAFNSLSPNERNIHFIPSRKRGNCIALVEEVLDAVATLSL